jgi:hypothetical protein
MASSVKVKFTANRAGINSVARSEGVLRDLEHRADLVIIEAERTAPVRTGQYAFGVGGPGGFHKSRFRARGGAGGVRVTATDPKAIIIELGSRAHDIEPKDKKALAWPGGGHPVKRVHHPGTPAQHILRDALRAARG